MAGKIFNTLKLRLKSQYTHDIVDPVARRKSLSYAKWLDLGFLRTNWTNDGKIAPDIYRSNNPTAARFKAYADRGIKTVLNLRHDVKLSPVKLAKEACDALGMTFVSYPMRTRRPPTKDELDGLIQLFKTIEKPVLIHCKSGADRTGLAGAVWLLTQENAPLEQAAKELSIRYLHRRDSEAGVLDAVLDLYTPYAQTMGFEDWVRDVYELDLALDDVKNHRPKLSIWAQIKSFFSDLYKYAQFREANWHKSFEGLSESEPDQKRARVFVDWVDHGILRRGFHNRVEIADGVIRSNHPTEKRIRQEASAGVKTFLNLRGASQQPQYLIEAELCRELGIKLIDLPMTAGRKPSRTEIENLLAAFDTCERPLLIHCKSGADRTGVAAAAYLLDHGADIEKAQKQLSIRFVHHGLGRKAALRDFLDDFQRDGTSKGLSFRDWVASLD